MKHVARSTLIVAIFFGMEKALGFIRHLLIARQFGLSTELDAYNAANNLPDLLFALISGGALALAFIPVLSETLQKFSRESMWVLFSRIANLVFLVTGGVSIIIALLADRIVRWELGIAPGFTNAQQTLVADLMRLNLVATLIFSIGGLVIAALQANQHFWLPAIAPSMYDLGMLVGVLVLAPEQGYQFGPVTLPALGMGIYGLVYGVIIGAACFLLIQVPGLLRYGFRWTPSLQIKHPAVQQVLCLMGPRVLTMFFIQFIFLAQDNLASRLPAGAVSALVYGWLFMQVPETILGTALGTALLPTLAEHAAREDLPQLRRTLQSSLKVILAFTIPAAALLAVCIQPVVSILGFDAPGTTLVIWTAQAYLAGLVGHSVVEVTVRAYYARKDARTPLLAAVLTSTAFLILATLLSPRLGAPGIALANTLAFTGEAALLWFLLERKMGGLKPAGNTLARAIPAALAGSLAALALLSLPFPPLLLAAAGLLLGGLIILPLILPEVRILLQL